MSAVTAPLNSIPSFTSREPLCLAGVPTNLAVSGGTVPWAAVAVSVADSGRSSTVQTAAPSVQEADAGTVTVSAPPDGSRMTSHAELATSPDSATTRLSRRAPDARPFVTCSTSSRMASSATATGSLNTSRSAKGEPPCSPGVPSKRAVSVSATSVRPMVTSATLLLPLPSSTTTRTEYDDLIS